MMTTRLEIADLQPTNERVLAKARAISTCYEKNYL